jgi:glycosyltransferase involved in cell wall biosynthesis
MGGRIDHFYGATTAVLGAGEDEFIAAASRPEHAWNECLRRVAAAGGRRAALHLLTTGRARRVESGGLEWALWPAAHASLHHLPPFDRVFRRAYAQSSPAFLAALRADPPDLFAFYGNVPSPFARRVADTLAGLGVPCVATLHTRLATALRPGTGPGERAGWVERALAGARPAEAAAVFGRATALIVLTERDRTEALAAGWLPPERVHVIPSGCHPDAFHPGDPAARGPFPTFAFAGRLEDAKGFREACEALARVRRAHPAATLEVAGRWTSDAYRREVEGVIAAHGLAAHVRMHGWLTPRALGDVYRRSHLLLFPSKSEGLPRAVLEAMTCGCPAAVVAGTGGHAELIRDGVDGVVAPRAAWAAAVAALADDPAALAALGVAAAARAAAEFTLEAMSARVARVYDGALANPLARTRARD